MRLLLMSLLAVLIAANTLQSAQAQHQFTFATSVNYLDVDPQALAEAAFSARYGRLLATQFAAVIGESADVTCLKTEGLDRTTLAERSRAILVRQAKQLIDIYAGTVDEATYRAKFAARKGPNAQAELARLRGHPDVRTFLMIAEPARLAEVANTVLDMADRYALLRRIKLARLVSPAATGDDALLDADPSDATVDKLEAFIESKSSPALTRYVELAEAAQQAFREAIRRDALLKIGPLQLMSGLDKALAEVCVNPR